MGFVSPAGLASLRRQFYLALLAAGMVGLIGMMTQDAQLTLGGAATPAAATRPGSATRPLTSESAMDGFGGWAPDGRQIAFMRDGQIWLMGAGGEHPKALTSSSAVWDAVPAWRPDGKQIAFARLSMHGEGAMVVLIDPATGKEQQVAREAEPVGHLAWDPAGAHVYYTTAQRLMRVDLGGRRQQVLQVAGDWDMLAGGLAITPDGKHAIFGAGPKVGQGVRYDLWVAALDGKGSGDLQQLTRGGGIMPNLDTTGGRMLYRNPRQSTGIYLMDVARHATRLILADEQGAMYFHPAFSPDGKRVLLSRLVLDAARAPEGRGQFTSHLYVHTLGASGGD
jgi:dipeptidyl aminopeptidase/acylaminoacyl peptidase